MVCYLKGDQKNKFNQTKIRILWAAKMLEDERQVINSTRIAKLTGHTTNNITTCLRNMVSYLKPEIDTEYTDHCTKKYTVTKQGKRVLEHLLDRLARGEHLNIRQPPGEHIDYSNFDLLPGFTQLQREQAGITGEEYEGVTEEVSS